MRIDVDKVKAELNLTPFGAQGWLQDKDSGCPFCDGKSKWGVRLNPYGGVFHCYKCGKKESLYKYLIQINRQDLCKITYENSVTNTLKPLSLLRKKQKIEEEIKEISMPRRLELLKDDPYLNSRGFTDFHYKLFEPSFTNFFMEKKLHDHIIFKMKIDNEVKAWLSRSRKPKEWHEQNLKDFKKGKARLNLRYENSENGFSHILGAIDTITDQTAIVFIVEGIFDYVNMSNIMDMENEPEVGCVFTFGDSINENQINLLLKKKGIETVILMYDYNTIKQSKSTGLLLSRFFSTKIACIEKEDTDPGNITLDYLVDILGNNLHDPINFYTDKLVI